MKAIALISGGLDSTLALKLIKDQGIEIIALNFKTPFCLCDKKGTAGCGSWAREAANNLGIELKMVNVTEEFLNILQKPKYGYGSNMNPCIDCRILMFRKAKELMQESGAAFVISGEVLGQRPMSQHKKALKIIERESGLEGLILRPLSAQLFPPTLPEKNGWVERNKLLNFNGRSRRPQMNLAQTFKIKDYPCSAGGCLLTDPGFAKRIKDLIKHKELNFHNVELLKVGRHFRFSPNAKLVVGRDESENNRLNFLAKDNDYLFRPFDIAGPVALGRGIFDDKLIGFSSSIVCRYSDINGQKSADIVYNRISDNAENKLLKVLPVIDSQLNNFRI